VSAFASAASRRRSLRPSCFSSLRSGDSDSTTRSAAGCRVCSRMERGSRSATCSHIVRGWLTSPTTQPCWMARDQTGHRNGSSRW